VALSVGLVAWTACSADDVVGRVEPDGDTDDSSCSRDAVDGPAVAGRLARLPASGTLAAEGSICPVGDRDWYEVDMPEGQGLLAVDLAVRGPLSPLQPTYAVESCDAACVATSSGTASGSCCESRAEPAADQAGEAVRGAHCLGAGEYFVVVRDRGDDHEDSRTPRGIYDLRVELGADPDALTEPNDGPEAATAPTATGPRAWQAVGHVACTGDQDWYVIDVPEGSVVDVTLTMGISALQPQFRLVDETGAVLGVETSSRGDEEATSLHGQYWLGSAGTCFVVVEDDDGQDSDASQAYDLSIR
jgi:hypothetical protein